MISSPRSTAAGGHIGAPTADWYRMIDSRRVRMLAVAAFLVAAVCGCAASSPEAGTEAAVEFAVDTARLSVTDSCGESFTVRDSAGTMRLTVRAPSSLQGGTAPGIFELGPNGWSGKLEVGSGLVVWPCHDVQNDFEGEHVREVWPVVGGTIELSDAIPAETGGGGGAGPVHAQLRSVAVESPSQGFVVFGPVEVVNSRWGFYGG